ncbi:MAG: flavin reductase family protein [Pseudomonadales bacterium]
MFYDSDSRHSGAETNALPFNPFKALVAPRPIGWISTLTEDGTVNLAPYSYFQAVADNPDIVLFSATPSIAMQDGAVTFGETRKDSEHNALTSGEFVCNLVSFELRHAMNDTSAHLPRTDSEATHTGLELTASTRVKVPRVASAPAALECVVVGSMPVPKRDGDHRYNMVFGEVVGIHINEDFIESGRVNTAAMQLVTRMGYDEYAVLEKAFAMPRPDFDPILSGVLKR